MLATTRPILSFKHREEARVYSGMIINAAVDLGDAAAIILLSAGVFLG